MIFYSGFSYNLIREKEDAVAGRSQLKEEERKKMSLAMHF
jgi:hypothetical protein